MMFRTALILIAILACMGVADSFAFDLSDADNKHNLSNQSNNAIKAQPLASGGTDRVCIFCHTPHSATPDTPLWSRPDPANVGSFVLYGQDLVIKGNLVGGGSSAGAQVTNSQYTTADPSAYPNGASRMCLSCHDGVTAIGLLNDNSTINMMGATTLVGRTSQISLSTAHPISFKYDAAVLADLENYYGALTYTLPDTGDAVDTPLDGLGRMQCTTCHDPHDDTRAAIGLPFWRQISVVFVDQYQDVCNACHAGIPALQGTNH
jgi:hypothetical protein